MSIPLLAAFKIKVKWKFPKRLQQPLPFGFTGNASRRAEVFVTYESQAPSLLIEQWKPLDPEGKKQYDREFLLDFQFMPACIQKPEGLPPISDVVLDKVRGEPIKQVRAIFFLKNINKDP